MLVTLVGSVRWSGRSTIRCPVPDTGDAAGDRNAVRLDWCSRERPVPDAGDVWDQSVNWHAVHSQNAPCREVVTLEGIVTLVRLVHP